MNEVPESHKSDAGGIPSLSDSSGPRDAPGVVQRFFLLFSSPRRAFQPPRTPAFLIVPLVALSVLVVAQTVLFHDLYTERSKSMIERNQSIPEAQKAEVLQKMDERMSSPSMEVVQILSAVARKYLIPALLYLLGLNFVLGARTRFAEVFAVTAFTGLVQIPKELIRTPLMLSRGTLDVFLGPAALAGSENPPLFAALNMFDLFDLFRLVLLAIGFSVLSGLPVRRTAWPVVVVWLLFGLAGVGCALSPLGQFMH